MVHVQSLYLKLKKKIFKPWKMTEVKVQCKYKISAIPDLSFIREVPGECQNVSSSK